MSNREERFSEVSIIAEAVQKASDRRFDVIAGNGDFEEYNYWLSLTWRDLIDNYGVSFESRLAISKLRFLVLNTTIPVVNLPFIDPTGSFYFPRFNMPPIDFFEDRYMSDPKYNPINHIFEDGDEFPIARLCYEIQRLIYTFKNDGFLSNMFYGQFSLYFGTHTDLEFMAGTIKKIKKQNERLRHGETAIDVYKEQLVNTLKGVIEDAGNFLTGFESLKIENTNVEYLEAINFLLKILKKEIPKRESARLDKEGLIDLTAKLVNSAVDGIRVENISDLISINLHRGLMQFFSRGEIILCTNRDGFRCIRLAKEFYRTYIDKKYKTFSALNEYFREEIQVIINYLSSTYENSIPIETLISENQSRCPMIDYSDSWERIMGLIITENLEFSYSKGIMRRLPPIPKKAIPIIIKPDDTQAVVVEPPIIKGMEQYTLEYLVEKICAGKLDDLTPITLSGFFTNPELVIKNIGMVAQLVSDLAHKSVTITWGGIITSVVELPSIAQREFMIPVAFLAPKGKQKEKTVVISLPIADNGIKPLDTSIISEYIGKYVSCILNPISNDISSKIANTCIELAKVLISEESKTM